jgi:hypothetical protein
VGNVNSFSTKIKKKGGLFMKILYINGKKACRYDPTTKQVEVAFKGYKAIVQFNEDGSVTIDNYDLEGKPQIV